jgi:diamine N-acetyltransferase
MNLTDIVRAQESDLADLRRISIKTFLDSFADVNTPENINLYVSTSFNEEKMANELKDPASEFYFYRRLSDIMGYMKVNFRAAQTDFKDPDGLEIERIYIDKRNQGRGAGAALMKYAEELARKSNLKYLWLGVWEHNTKAIAFYSKTGFKAAGSHHFMLGNDAQTDIIMKKYL